MQSDCAKLSTLTTSPYSTNTVVLNLDALTTPQVVTKALTLVDARLRAISSLQNIIVEMYEGGPSDHTIREVKSRGWIINSPDIQFGVYKNPESGEFWIDGSCQKTYSSHPNQNSRVEAAQWRFPTAKIHQPLSAYGWDLSDLLTLRERPTSSRRRGFHPSHRATRPRVH